MNLLFSQLNRIHEDEHAPACGRQVATMLQKDCQLVSKKKPLGDIAIDFM